jgi:hypothetical protein
MDTFSEFPEFMFTMNQNHPRIVNSRLSCPVFTGDGDANQENNNAQFTRKFLMG